MQMAEPVIPRNADDIVHNVAIRQLMDDQAQPPPAREQNHVLGVMRGIVDRAREGRSMAEYKPLIEKYTQANSELAQVLGHLFLRYKNDAMVNWLETEERLETFLRRCMARGDLSPAEALVFLKMSKDEIRYSAEQLKEQIEHGVPDLDAQSVVTKLDYTLALTEREAMKGFEKTTPQGREIVRKLVLRARKKLK